MKWYKKFVLDSRLLFHSLFHGMKAADEVISQNASYGTGDTEINQLKKGGTVFDDMLRGEVTDQVEEERDRYYRVLRESDKYRVNVAGMFDENGDYSNTEVKTTVSLKTANDFAKLPPLYMENGEKLRLIQPNTMISKTWDNININDIETSYDSMITIEYGDFTPRFRLDKHVTKIVVKETNNGVARFDLYVSMYPGQFNKVDALFVSEMNRLREEQKLNGDVTEIKRLHFVTDKACYGEEILTEFEYGDITFLGVEVFDGSFVLKYVGKPIIDGVNVSEKFKTESLTKKYEECAYKGDGIDIFAYQRKCEKEKENSMFNTNTIFKLD